MKIYLFIIIGRIFFPQTIVTIVADVWCDLEFILSNIIILIAQNNKCILV